MAINTSGPWTLLVLLKNRDIEALDRLCHRILWASQMSEVYLVETYQPDAIRALPNVLSAEEPKIGGLAAAPPAKRFPAPVDAEYIVDHLDLSDIANAGYRQVSPDGPALDVVGWPSQSVQEMWERITRAILLRALHLLGSGQEWQQLYEMNTAAADAAAKSGFVRPEVLALAYAEAQRLSLVDSLSRQVPVGLIYNTLDRRFEQVVDPKSELGRSWEAHLAALKAVADVLLDRLARALDLDTLAHLLSDAWDDPSTPHGCDPKIFGIHWENMPARYRAAFRGGALRLGLHFAARAALLRRALTQDALAEPGYIDRGRRAVERFGEDGYAALLDAKCRVATDLVNLREAETRAEEVWADIRRRWPVSGPAPSPFHYVPPTDEAQTMAAAAGEPVTLAKQRLDESLAAVQHLEEALRDGLIR